MNKKTPFHDANSAIKAVELESLNKGEVYPVTIVSDRYGGTYSNGKWLAFQLDPADIPEEVGGSDPEEMIFWDNHDSAQFPIGKGNTPNEALESLRRQLINYYNSW